MLWLINGKPWGSAKDHLGLMMPNCHCFTSWIEVWSSDGQYQPFGICAWCAYEFEDAMLKGIVCFENAAERVMRALQQYPVPVVVVTRLGDELPKWKNTLLHWVLR